MGQLSNFHLHDSFLGIPVRHRPGYHFHRGEPASFRSSLVKENVLEQNDSKHVDSKECEKMRVLNVENTYLEVFVKVIPEKALSYFLK